MKEEVAQRAWKVWHAVDDAPDGQGSPIVLAPEGVGKVVQQRGATAMGKVLEVSDETYQQFTTLAEQQHRTPEDMLRLCLQAYEHYQYHLVHQDMVAEGLLDAIPLLRPLDAEEEEDFEPEVIPGKPLSEIILEERR